MASIHDKAPSLARAVRTREGAICRLKPYCAIILTRTARAFDPFRRAAIGWRLSRNLLCRSLIFAFSSCTSLYPRGAVVPGRVMPQFALRLSRALMCSFSSSSRSCPLAMSLSIRLRRISSRGLIRMCNGDHADNVVPFIGVDRFQPTKYTVQTFLARTVSVVDRKVYLDIYCYTPLAWSCKGVV